MEEINVPEWLTADFLKSCLQSNEEKFKEIDIINYSVEPAVPAGNNYGSLMLRVKIDYKELDEAENSSVSLIIKAPLEGGFIKQISESLKDLYEKEPKYYGVFINETYKLCKHNIVPKHYKSPNPLCVVLEDLKTSGYVMVDRQNLLDFDHCQLYIKASAKLHALSVAIHKKNPEIIEFLVKDNPMFSEKGREMFKGMMIGGLQCIAAYLEDKPQYKGCMEVINEVSESGSFWTIFGEMERSKKSLKALIQGDPWCTNMMFKYNPSGRVTAVKLFDFQGLKFTTPVTEFITFIWVSVRPDVRKERLNELYHLYCDSLNENLSDLGCPERLSFEEMKAEIRLLSPLVLTVISCMLPVCIGDGVANLTDFSTVKSTNTPLKESPMYKYYQGTAFNRFYPQVIEQAANEGVFDYMKEKLNELKN